VVITELTGANQPGRPVTISRVFASGEIANFAQPMIGGVAPSAWQTDVKTRWPDGSVRHAMISFRAALAGGASITVSFVSNANPCSSGNQGACDAAALNQQGMVDFNAGQGAGSWRARIEGIASGISQGAEARAMIAAGKWSYWLRGPVVTQVIVEDRSPALSQDFGWQCTANCTGDYATATWSGATSATYRSLHPIFVASFYPGYPGVEVDYILENPWSTRLQDQRYTLNLYGNYPEVNIFSNPSLPHWARSRWHKKLWSGATPGRVKVDHNLPYLIESRALPNFDLTKHVPSNTVASVLSRWAGTDKGAIMGDYLTGTLHNTGFWSKYMPGTGGREEIGLFPTWVVRYLYTFHTTADGNDLYNVMLGNADAVSQAPMHNRDGNPDPNIKFCALSQTCLSAGLNSVPAWGLQRSRDAYPQGTGTTPVATLSSAHYWTLDTAHQGSMAYVPYLVTGDWYYLQEMNFWAAWDIERSPPGTNRWYMGHNDWGYLRDQVRGMAWSLRNVGHAAVMNPDGTPEKSYFSQKILNNIAIHEGKHDIRNGYGYGGDNTKWQWGYTQGSGVADVDTTTHIANPLDYVAWEAPSMEGMDTSKVSAITPQWQVHFFFIVIAHLEELGFPTTALKTAVGKNIINQLQNPNFNPWLIDTYRTPAIMLATRRWAQTWSEALSGYIASEQTRTGWLTPSAATNSDSGYPVYARAAAAFLPGITDGPYTGDGAWLWFTGKLNESMFDSNPKWAFVPRRNVAPATPSCDLNGDGQVNITDVQMTINNALNGVFSGVGDLDGDGRSTVIDTQRTVNASLGSPCRLGP